MCCEVIGWESLWEQPSSVVISFQFWVHFTQGTLRLFLSLWHPAFLLKHTASPSTCFNPSDTSDQWSLRCQAPSQVVLWTLSSLFLPVIVCVWWNMGSLLLSHRNEHWALKIICTLARFASIHKDAERTKLFTIHSCLVKILASTYWGTGTSLRNWRGRKNEPHTLKHVDSNVCSWE